MHALLHSDRTPSIRALAEQGVVLPTLRARTSEQAIRELAQALASGTPMDGAVLAETVLAHDGAIACGLSDGVALPHARIPGLQRVMLAVGRAPVGIDVDAVDGVPARLFFLLLIPLEKPDSALDVYGAIMEVVSTESARNALLEAKDRGALLDALANRI